MASEPISDPAPPPRLAGARAAEAGAIAAAVMLTAQLIWRLNWSSNGVVQAFPEFIVSAVARLTPLSIFGAATENYGSLAKKSLFVGVLLGVIAVGAWGGRLAQRIAGAVEPRPRAGIRLLASAIVAGLFLLITGGLILPIAYLGVFATASSYTADILTQLILTFALYAVVVALLTSPAFATGPSAMPITDDTISRRAALTRAGWATASIAAFLALGGSAWRILSPKPRSTAQEVVTALGSSAPTEAPHLTAKEIVATQRAEQGYEEETPTPKPQAATEPEEVAALNNDATTTDPIARFDQLEAEGKLTPVLTEVKDFYHVSKNISDPTVSAEGWTLTIGGSVNTPLTLTYADLVKRATTHKITTLMCISNDINGDLAGTALWQGVPLADLLKEAGVKPGAIKVKAHAADDYEDSFPIDRGLNPNTMVVIGQNGQPLGDDHGFPARLIVPGIYGMKNVKWVDKIELVDEDFKGFWETRGWSDTAIYQIWGRIDSPKQGEKIPAGSFTAAGLASAGDRDIKKVEVTFDDGETWATADLEPSLNPPLTWVRWAYTFQAKPGPTQVIKIRITDGQGNVAPKEDRDPLPDGPTGWPSRSFKVG